MSKRSLRLFLAAAALCALAGVPLAHAGATVAPLGADGTGLPGFAAADRLRGGETAVLRGLPGRASDQADLGILNLATARSTCTLTLTDAAGRALAPPVRFTLRAGESRPFVDALGDSAVHAAVADARVSCSGDFYAYALLTHRSTGTLVLMTPEHGRGAIAFKAGKAPCPPDADCFDAPGVDHVPSPTRAVGRVAFPAPTGTARRIVLSLDVTIADWYADNPAGKHLIYWFVISKNQDMPGMLYFLGPGKDEAFIRHGIGLKHPDKIKGIKSFTAKVGHTYHVVNDYDMASRRYTVTITDAATGQVTTLTSIPNVTSYTFKPKQSFLVDMGFPPVKDNPTEVPSYKWKYANLHIETYLQ